MKLPKNYFESLSARKYREYLKLLPPAKQERTYLFINLALTFAALSFFGIFAINPVLSTITDLKRQLADNKLVDQQLETKITNLSLLQQQYNSFPQADLQTINAALPPDAAIPKVVGQIQTIAQQSKITILSLNVAEVQLLSNKQLSPQGSSFSFFMEGKGSYDDMLNFSSNLTQFDRIVTIDSLSVYKDIKDNGLILALQGRSYFKK